MEPNYKIRGASIDDVDTVFSFISHLEERTFDFEPFKERFSENLNRRAKFIWSQSMRKMNLLGLSVATDKACLHHEGKVFEIQEMYVARNYRDRGIGKALFAALEERLSKMECESLEVTANIKRSDARKFYTKLGFVQTHVKFVKER